ncbi:hypothetical protein LJC08_03125 [Methanimicrococcus sp. OttesenSCG-928-J09]|nr:hypothetical protein [Methanimicrococcus sp. OttesenSCG-928-J09]
MVIMAENTKNRPLNINNISRLFISLILLSVIFSSVPPAGAVESDTGSYFSADYIQEIIDNTPATNPNLLEQARFNNTTVAVYGRIPALPRGNESYRWFTLLQGTMKKVNEDGKLEPYLWDNGGFIIGYGCPSEMIQIFVYSGAEYSDEDLEAIVKIVQDAGKEYGIEDIPIIVESNALAQGYINDMSAKTEPAAPKTIPGVGLATCALLVMVAVFFVRKSKK